eukprot:gnl/Dysnectes_brevis/1495_a1693_1697.p1 GENE.gnl/Dysnectes_brevis/1495_a1693_1697~~gnl/Dysnectes_brevis/1495_a1693_1697.p1  ORF type:complete len:741 (-),score=263.99 gnl/Dysnectes_brevis/1495_a1693_1697:120-2342(-)
MTGFTFTVTQHSRSQKALALTNKVYINADDYDQLQAGKEGLLYLEFNNTVYLAARADHAKSGRILLNVTQRNMMRLSIGKSYTFNVFTPSVNHYATELVFSVDVRRTSDRGSDIDGDQLVAEIKAMNGNQAFIVGQEMIFAFSGINLLLSLKSFAIPAVGDDSSSPAHCILHPNASVRLARVPQAALKISGSAMESRGATLLSPNFNMEDLGIGGLDTQFQEIFRRAFASRVFPPAVAKRLGLQHVRGILLFGPPGTGKTLMARQIGKMLNSKEPKVVSGPEVLDMYVGKSEANVRALFADAEKDQKELGDDSELHIVIFDELDAICKQRGMRSDSTGTFDSVVNQLLAKMDGVEALDNLLIIGMTNRKDLIDSALLRPGRFEVHLEISLPDRDGRHQILRIHTASMRESGSLSPDVDLPALAERTKNFSGAELAGLVRSAASFALAGLVDPAQIAQLDKIDPESIVVTQECFEGALKEVRPDYGRDQLDLGAMSPLGFIPVGKSISILDDIMGHIAMVQKSAVRLGTLLLHGQPGSGKTAILSHVIQSCNFDYVKLISAQDLILKSIGDVGKVAIISKAFEDAYKVPEALIILDGLEQIIQWSRVGARYSNVILQSLLALLKRSPPAGRRLVVIGTVSQYSQLRMLGMTDVFDRRVRIPQLSPADALEALTLHATARGSTFSPDKMDPALLEVRSPQLAMKPLLLAMEYSLVAGEEVDQGRLAMALENFIPEYDLRSDQ